MKILMVALSDSIHSARWISQIADQGWDVRLFPSIDSGMVHPELKDVTVYHTLGGGHRGLERKLWLQKYRLPTSARVFIGAVLFPLLRPRRRVQQLLQIIRDFQPDLVHSLEFQAAGYLVLAAKLQETSVFPPWIATNWGSDIYYFRRFPEHEERIREVLELCDYYTCECERDVILARQYGLKGRLLSVMPNAGGIDLRRARMLRKDGATSSRRIIMLKGYHHWAGRALVGLQALAACKDLLRGYSVFVYSASPAVKAAVGRFRKATGIQTIVVPRDTPHEEILRLHGMARLSIGLSLGDGISTSFLEAITMGSFPIQSRTACANEWIGDGRTGILVPPEDVNIIGQAIRRGLSDDGLVDNAAEENWRTVSERLDYEIVRRKAIDMYLRVGKERGIGGEE